MKRSSLVLLGSALSIIQIGGARAADLPVKARPVEYVKVCSLYGAGFYYMPGTDTCIKIGGYVRTQSNWNADGGGLADGFGDTTAAGAGRFTRSDTDPLTFRHRFVLSADVRTQTEYGTLRAYATTGAQQTTPGGPSIFFNRAFVQFAGFTTGRAVSFFDVNSLDPYSYATSRVSNDTGATGINVFAYTAQIGNGLSATLSFEDGGAGPNGSSGRGRLVSNLQHTSFGLGTVSFDNAGWKVPDAVGALRIDQAWGYAQVAGALHDVSGAYYGGADSTLNGHPGDKLGWALTGGFTLNNALGMRGDQFGFQGTYSQGAAGYVTRAIGPFQVYSSNSNAGFGWITDGVFDSTAGPTPIELTTVWGLTGFYQHFWNPKWRTSVYGGYVAVDYNDAAETLVNRHLPGAAGTRVCNGVAVAGTILPPLGIPAVNDNACSPDFSWWQVGTRTQWNPVPDLDVGVDFLWSHLNTAYKGTNVTLAQNGARPAGVYTIDDQDVFTVMFRVQRNFLP